MKYDKKIIDVLTYCHKHIDQMWAASIVGILLDCDFMDSKDALKKLKLEPSICEHSGAEIENSIPWDLPTK